MNYPKVSIIILNLNGLDDTVECLQSLKKITYPNYQVIVVDNGSKGNDAQVLQEKFGDYIHLIKNDRNYGFAEGANIGMRYALNNSAPDYVLLLNNDTVVDPEFLTEMVKVAESDAAIGIAGAKLYYYDNPNRLQSLWGRIDFWRGLTIQTPKIVAEKIKSIELDEGQYNQIREVDIVSGCCSLIKKRTLDDIGLLDKSYFFGWEDVDYCVGASKKGYKIIYVPNAKIWHKSRQSAVKMPELACYYRTRNRFRLVKKHATRWQYRCFLIYFFGFYFWLSAGYYLRYYHSLKVLTSFYRGVRDGLLNSEDGAKLYVKD